jgi:hypothetical protein
MGGIRSIRFHNKWDTGVVIYGAIVRDTSDKAVWSDGHSIQVGKRHRSAQSRPVDIFLCSTLLTTVQAPMLL